MSIFPSHNQWHSLENICHKFLMPHCRVMSWECKYYSLCIMFLQRPAVLGSSTVTPTSPAVYRWRRCVMARTIVRTTATNSTVVTTQRVRRINSHAVTGTVSTLTGDVTGRMTAMMEVMNGTVVSYLQLIYWVICPWYSSLFALVIIQRYLLLLFGNIFFCLT